MACPASGKITIQDLVNEFGGSAPHALTEYYRNGALVPGNNTNVAESGQISLTQFYSAVNEILHTHSDGDTHANYATIFGSNWASTVPKRVVVPSGVTVGGTSTHAMLLPSGMGGTIVFDISGNVYGYGGAANGGTGGNAIHCTQTSGVTININSGANVKAGGGGGGQGGSGGAGGAGGTGGQGGQGTSSNYVGNNAVVNCGAGSYWGLDYCRNSYGHGYITHASHSGGCFSSGTDYLQRWNCYSTTTTNGGNGGSGGAGGTSGGAGGAGGVGQGYNQSAASGSAGGTGSSGSTGAAGSSAGGNAGTGGQGGTGGTAGNGGTGGAGGSFGNAGSNGNAGAQGGTGAQGNTGSNGNSTNGSSGASGSAGSNGASGQSGGAAGYYIYNRNSITLNNSGTVAGQ